MYPPVSTLVISPPSNSTPNTAKTSSLSIKLQTSKDINVNQGNRNGLKLKQKLDMAKGSFLTTYNMCYLI